jgi:hypothetical protein
MKLHYLIDTIKHFLFLSEPELVISTETKIPSKLLISFINFIAVFESGR